MLVFHREPLLTSRREPTELTVLQLQQSEVKLIYRVMKAYNSKSSAYSSTIFYKCWVVCVKTRPRRRDLKDKKCLHAKPLSRSVHTVFTFNLFEKACAFEEGAQKASAESCFSIMCH